MRFARHLLDAASPGPFRTRRVDARRACSTGAWMAALLLAAGCGGGLPSSADASALDASSVDGALDGDAIDAPVDAPAPRFDAHHDLVTSDAGLAANQCRSQADCRPGFQCLAPGESAGCGTCRPADSPCTTDGNCASFGKNFICDTTPCTCSGEKTCLPGCAMDTDCPTGQTCGVDHRCGSPACASDTQCGPNGTCSNGRCAPTACTTDGDCADFCVKGGCYNTPGTCTALPQ